MKRDRFELCVEVVGKKRAEYERAIALWALFLALVSSSIAPTQFGDLGHGVWFAIVQLVMIYGLVIGGVTISLVSNYARIRGLEANLETAMLSANGHVSRSVNFVSKELSRKSGPPPFLLFGSGAVVVLVCAFITGLPIDLSQLTELF